MVYKSPYRLAILLERKKLLEKEQEIALFRTEQNKLLQRLQSYEKEEADFYDFLSEEREFDAALLNRKRDGKGKKAVELLLEKARIKIQQLTVEYAQIKQRMETIQELDKEKEKEFNKEKQKKESKKIESVMFVKKQMEEGENGRDYKKSNQ